MAATWQQDWRPKRHELGPLGSPEPGTGPAAHDRAALERLCRYGARPAFAQERLAWTADGRIAYKLKRPWPDGCTHLVMEPVAFLRRLVGDRSGTLAPTGRRLLTPS